MREKQTGRANEARNQTDKQSSSLLNHNKFVFTGFPLTIVFLGGTSIQSTFYLKCEFRSWSPNSLSFQVFIFIKWDDSYSIVDLTNLLISGLVHPSRQLPIGLFGNVIPNTMKDTTMAVLGRFIFLNIIAIWLSGSIRIELTNEYSCVCEV